MSAQHKKSSYATVIGKGVIARKGQAERARQEEVTISEKKSKLGSPQAKAVVENEEEDRESNEDEEEEEHGTEARKSMKSKEESGDSNPILLGILQQQQQMMAHLMEAQKRQDQVVERWMQSLGQPAGAGSSMVPLPISISAARRTLFETPGPAEKGRVGKKKMEARVQRAELELGQSEIQELKQLEVEKSTAPVQKLLELEKLALFQGEMDSEKLDA
jgi:hypothetical protein